MSFQVFAFLKIGLFGFVFLSCVNAFIYFVLYILGINLLPYMWFANISPHSTGYLLYLLIVSFVVQ